MKNLQTFCSSKMEQNVLANTDIGKPETLEIHESSAEKRSQSGDLAFINELAQKVLSVLAPSLERLETPEGDAKDGQNVTPETPDPNTSQQGLTSDLTTGTTVLADPDSVICEIPEIQEPADSEIGSLIPARKPHMSDYETSKLISSGVFGAVYLVRHKDSHQICALKKMAKKNLKTPRKMKSAFLERDILTYADCPFVVSMLCSFPTRSHLCMVMEYVGGGDCRTLLYTRGRLSVPLARLYFAEAALGLEYLHSIGVVHRDLKPANMLITPAGHIKLTDFGLSKLGVMIPKTNRYKESAEDIAREFMDREACGTPYYKAPEVILKKGYGRPVDWWAMGITLHEFLLGFVPFDRESITDLYESVVAGDIIWHSELAPPPDAQDLITKLLQTNPAARLGTGGAHEIKSHPFLSDLDIKNLLSQTPEYIPQLVSDMDTSLFINHFDVCRHLVSEDEEDTSEDKESLDFQNFTSSSERLSKLCTTTTRMMTSEDPKSPAEGTPESIMKNDEDPRSPAEGTPASIAKNDEDPRSPAEGTPASITKNDEDPTSPAEGTKASITKNDEDPTSPAEGTPASITKNDEDPTSPAKGTPASSKNISEMQKESFPESDRDDAITSLPPSSPLSEFPAEEERTSAVNLSVEKENPENREKGKKRRGSIFRRVLSSCRRGISRAARVFACCHRSPKTI